MKEFEIGKTYFAKYKIKRVFFKVTERTPRTVTLSYIGTQNEGGWLHPHAIDVAGNGELQKSRVHLDEQESTEYGYVKIEDENPWMGKLIFREAILAKDEARLPA